MLDEKGFRRVFWGTFAAMAGFLAAATVLCALWHEAMR